MTEQTPKLDVQTLKYVLSLIENEGRGYGLTADHCAKCGEDYDADRFDAKRLAMESLGRTIRYVIDKVA